MIVIVFTVLALKTRELLNNNSPINLKLTKISIEKLNVKG